MRRSDLLAALILVAVSVGPVLAQPTASGDRERGRYLVERVAMCIQCHTPRDPNGNLLRTELFTGAAVPVSQPSWVKEWALRAPRIAGMPGYTEADAIRLLTTGISRNGRTLLAPMPPFRMNEQDARDIYSYVSSLR